MANQFTFDDENDDIYDTEEDIDEKPTQIKKVTKKKRGRKKIKKKTVKKVKKVKKKSWFSKFVITLLFLILIGIVIGGGLYVYDIYNKQENEIKDLKQQINTQEKPSVEKDHPSQEIPIQEETPEETPEEENEENQEKDVNDNEEAPVEE